MLKKYLLYLVLAAVPLITFATTVVPLGQVVSTSVIISSSTSTSGSVTTNGMSLVGCQLPSTMTGTQLSFIAATSTTATYQEVVDSSGQVKYTVAGGEFLSVTPTDFYGIPYFKIVSNASEAATRTLTCYMKGI